MVGEHVERLDFSQPPPNWRVHPGPLGMVAAWDQYKSRNDPPGMWSGYGGRIPELTVYLPRMGAGLVELTHDVAGLDKAEYPNYALARAAGRTAAWAWYERRLKLHESMSRLALGAIFAGVRDTWPRILTWSDEQMATVDDWLKWNTTTGQKVARPPALPEVLRVR